MTLKELLSGLRADLNDITPAGTLGTRWSDSQILRYFNEGLCHVYTVKPTQFLHEVILELDAGSVQKFCNCEHLHKILGQTDETGLIVRPIKEIDMGMQARWGKKPCPTDNTSAFTLTGLSLDSRDDGYFMVTPPVPPHEHVYLKALCANPPQALSLADVDSEIDQECSTVNAARQWVLYSALMVDDESQTSLVAARVHLSTFFSLLQLQMTQQRARQIGVALSQEGANG